MFQCFICLKIPRKKAYPPLPRLSSIPVCAPNLPLSLPSWRLLQARHTQGPCRSRQASVKIKAGLCQHFNGSINHHMSSPMLGFENRKHFAEASSKLRARFAACAALGSAAGELPESTSSISFQRNGRKGLEKDIKTAELHFLWWTVSSMPLG